MKSLRSITTLLGVLVLLATAVLTGCDSQEDSTHTVSYSVTGAAESASIIYTTSNGEARSETAPLPWSLEIEVNDGVEVVLQAIALFDVVTVRILVDGREVGVESGSPSAEVRHQL